MLILVPTTQRTGCILIMLVCIFCAFRYKESKIKGTKPGAFSFFVLGDFGMKGGEQQIPIAEQMIKKAAIHHPALILTVGDNFYETGVTSATDDHWTSSYTNIYKNLTHHYDWYASLGNHDYAGVPQAEIDYHQVNHRWNMPARYYTFVRETPDHQKVRFVAIDTSPYADVYYTNPMYAKEVATQDTSRQTRWIDSVLSNAKEKWKVVFGHHPAYCYQPKPGETENVRKMLVPLFDKYGVQAYICGHDHLMQHNVPEGSNVNYIISGGGAKPRITAGKENYTLFSLNVTAFTICTIKGDSLHFSFVDTAGNAIYKQSIYHN